MNGRNQFIRNPRDENGWLIPRSGTIARKVYDLLKEGKSRKEIMAATHPLKEHGIDARIWRIKNPDIANARRNEANAKRPKRVRASASAEPGMAPEAIAFFKGMATAFREAGLYEQATQIEDDAKTAHRVCRKHGLRFEAQSDAFKIEPQ